MFQASFEEVVRAWLLDYDSRVPSKSRERKEAFVILLGNLQNYGYNKDSLTKDKKEKIVRSCVNPNHYSKQKLRTWISMVVDDLENAILIYYGSIKINRDVITPEMAAKLDGLEKKAEESRALRLANKKEYDDVKDDLEEPLNIESAVRDAIANPTIKQGSVEITEEMLDEMDGPNVVWDEDFAKRLGLDDE